MASLADLTNPSLAYFTWVPPVGPGVCDICHRAPNAGYSRCYSCTQVMGKVTHPINLVVPISLYQTGGQLWDVLRYYKDGRTQRQRAWLTRLVAGCLGRFMHEHSVCIARASSEWDMVTTVPSSKGRDGVHPLRSALQMLPLPVADQEVELLRPGAVQVSHNQADDRGYTAIGDVKGRRVLLVDDTFTSGPRLQSAASALQLAGGAVVAAVVIGRSSSRHGVLKPSSSGSRRGSSSSASPAAAWSHRPESSPRSGSI